MWVLGGVERVDGVVPRGFVGLRGLLVDAGQFPDDESEDVGEQRVERAHGVAVGESGGDEDAVDLLELVEYGSDGETAVGQDARQGGMCDGGIAQRAEVADDTPLPVVGWPVGDVDASITCSATAAMRSSLSLTWRYRDMVPTPR